MPWIEVSEPHAGLPRRPRVTPGAIWTGPLDIDDGWAEVVGARLVTGSRLDVAGCERLTFEDAHMNSVVLDGSDGLVIEARRSVFEGCDLSRRRLELLRGVRLTGCKLAGTDLSAATFGDVEFESCSFRYANLRMAKLKRVRFVDCDLEDVDGYELVAEDVAFPGSRLSMVDLDRMAATRVDLRDAAELTITAPAPGSLAGCLVAEHQLPALADSLAHAAGLAIERSPTD